MEGPKERRRGELFRFSPAKEGFIAFFPADLRFKELNRIEIILRRTGKC